MKTHLIFMMKKVLGRVNRSQDLWLLCKAVRQTSSKLDRIEFQLSDGLHAMSEALQPRMANEIVPCHLIPISVALSTCRGNGDAYAGCGSEIGSGVEITERIRTEPSARSARP
jgi:hypothetical protein